MQTKVLIGGKFVAGEGPPEAILNPATGEPIARDAHGGVKQSGYGKDMSIWGLEDYTVVRHVMVAH